MTKPDGSFVTVKFDKNLKVTKVENGIGAGDPAPANQGAPGATGELAGVRFRAARASERMQIEA
jgi:hypothetical protein